MNWEVLIGIAAAVVPSILTGLALQRISAMESHQRHKEELRIEECYLTLKNMDAIGTLAELTAKIVGEGKSNGDLKTALKYRVEQKHAYEDFLLKLSAENKD